MSSANEKINYKHADYSLGSFISELTDNGFDTHNIGGSHDSNFSSGEVFRFTNGQYQLLGQSESILTCTPNVFYKTLIDVQSQFNYQLFG